MPTDREKLEHVPPAVRIALRVLLNHVEPRWANCSGVVRMWLDGEFPYDVDDLSTEKEQ